MDDAKPNTAERRAFIALVQTAIKKQASGQVLEAKERRAWDRWEAEENERRGRRWLAALPKKTYCDLVGRQPKVVNEQADAYGIPLRGGIVDALGVLKWIHDFFAKHKHVLPQVVRGEATESTPRDQLVLEQIEVYRRRVTLLEDKIAVNNQTLLPRDEIHELLAQLAKILRGAGEKLQKQFGPQAASILEVALTDFEAILVSTKPKTEAAATQLGDAATTDDRRTPVVSPSSTSAADPVDPPIRGRGNHRSRGAA